MVTRFLPLALSAATAFLAAVPVLAQTLAPREAPAKILPVPTTVSPQMQAIIAQPLRINWNKPPTTTRLARTLGEQRYHGRCPDSRNGPAHADLH